MTSLRRPVGTRLRRVEPAPGISRPIGMRNRALVTSLLAVIAISACTASHAGHSATSTVQRSASPIELTRAEATARISTAIRKPTVAGTNRAFAVAAAARAYRHFPVPPGSTSVATAPRHAPHQQRLGAYIGPVEPSLTRTGWWLVPLRYDRLLAWYAAHSRADVSSTLVSGATTPSRAAELDWVTHDTSAAYSTPVVVVDYAQYGPHLTALRLDVTLAARADRTAKTLVPATVTSLDITKKAIDGPDHAPTTVTVTDPRPMLTAVAAFDHLRGGFASTRPQGCGSPVGLVYVYAVTFHWPDHTLIADPGEELCGVGRGLTLDDTHLPQTLQNNAELDTSLKAAFDGS